MRKILRLLEVKLPCNLRKSCKANLISLSIKSCNLLKWYVDVLGFPCRSFFGITKPVAGYCNQKIIFILVIRGPLRALSRQKDIKSIKKLKTTKKNFG